MEVNQEGVGQQICDNHDGIGRDICRVLSHCKERVIVVSDQIFRSKDECVSINAFGGLLGQTVNVYSIDTVDLLSNQNLIDFPLSIDSRYCKDPTYVNSPVLDWV